MPTASCPTRNGERAERDGDEPNAIPFLKRFTVFNTDQCENLPAELTTAPAPVPDGLILPHAEALIAATGADFRIGGERAFYSPAHDFIQVPRPEAYFEPINWHRTALHELGHWSWPSLTARTRPVGHFGSALYAKEELVAEMTSAFVCASLGIVPTVRHADYIGSWLEVCARMIAPSCAPPAPRPRRPTICSRFVMNQRCLEVATAVDQPDAAAAQPMRRPSTEMQAPTHLFTRRRGDARC